MRKHAIYFVIILLSLYISASNAHAGYMLPYPSSMPGSKLYTVSRVLDSLKRYWYFGHIAQTKYHLQLSDKYLVEAKTLFEYEQYLLGMDALLRSDMHFSELKQALDRVKSTGKDPRGLAESVSGASDTHIAVLNSLQTVTPSEFTWNPESGSASYIPIHTLITESKKIRIAVQRDVAL